MIKQQREFQSEEEHIEFVEVSNEFWRRFSQLCNEMIAKAPEGLESYYELCLGEMTSIYGRDTKATPVKVFTCNNFIELYPVPTASVMLAPSKEAAEEMLKKELKELKLLNDQKNNLLEIKEVDITESKLLMLSIGDY